MGGGQAEEARRRRPRPLRELVKGCNEVVECYELLGETDCLLKLYLPNLEAFSTFMHDFLLKLPEVDVTHSSVALREIKNETALPL